MHFSLFFLIYIQYIYKSIIIVSQRCVIKAHNVVGCHVLFTSIPTIKHQQTLKRIYVYNLIYLYALLKLKLKTGSI